MNEPIPGRCRYLAKDIGPCLNYPMRDQDYCVSHGKLMHGKWFFTVQGRPQVKKNRKQITKSGRLVSSKEYQQWEKDAVTQLQFQWNRKPAIDRLGRIWLNAAIISYLGARQRPDADNLYAGPLDALQLAGILDNDYCIVSHDGSRRLRDKDNPRVEISLTEVEI